MTSFDPAKRHDNEDFFYDEGFLSYSCKNTSRSWPRPWIVAHAYQSVTRPGSKAAQLRHLWPATEITPRQLVDATVAVPYTPSSMEATVLGYPRIGERSAL